MLQARINAAPASSVLDLTGCTYLAGATVSKPLTLKGATIKPPAGTTGLLIQANDVTLDGLHLTGPQATTYVGGEYGVLGDATLASPILRLTIRNCEIDTFGNMAVSLRHATDLVAENNQFHDTVYAGIIVMSAVRGRISTNVIKRIGVMGAAANGNNAYGIAVSRIVTNLTDDPPSADVLVTGNTIEDVPTWHALDTHAGLRITFSNNVVRRCSRGLFITTDSVDTRAVDIVITGNQLLSPAPVTFNLDALTLYNVNGVTITGNTITGWGSTAPYYDYLGLSTGIVASGNTVTP